MNELRIALEYYITAHLVGVFCSRPIRIRPPAETCRYEMVTSNYIFSFFSWKIIRNWGKVKKGREERIEKGNPCIGIIEHVSLDLWTNFRKREIANRITFSIINFSYIFELIHFSAIFICNHFLLHFFSVTIVPCFPLEDIFVFISIILPIF